jgi:hypothetical protein
MENRKYLEQRLAEQTELLNATIIIEEHFSETFDSLRNLLVLL